MPKAPQLLQERRTWSALAHFISITSRIHKDAWLVIDDVIEGRALKPLEARLRRWLFTTPNRDELRRRLGRIKRLGNEMGADKAAAWLVVVSVHLGVATPARIEALTHCLQIALPSELNETVRSLDEAYGLVNHGPPTQRRSDLRCHVMDWILEMFPDSERSRSGTRAGGGEPSTPGALPKRPPETLRAAIERFFRAADGVAAVTDRPPLATRPTRAPALHLRPPAPDTHLDRLRNLVWNHTHLHYKAHMLHQREHHAELTGLIDDFIQAGDQPRIAEPICDLLPVHSVLETFDVRERHTRALADAIESNEVPQAARLHALIEGLGTNGDWRSGLKNGVPRVLDPAVQHHLQETRLRAEQGLNDRGGSISDNRALEVIRRCQISQGVLLRVTAAYAELAQGDPACVHRLYGQAVGEVQVASHESLEASILLDTARFEKLSGRLESAWQFAEQAATLAAHQRNDRRHLRATLEKGRILVALGRPEMAWTALLAGRRLFDRLQADRHGKPLPDWYQPGLRLKLDALEAHIRIDLPDGPGFPDVCQPLPLGYRRRK